MLRKLFLILILLCAIAHAYAQVYAGRETILLNFDWKFAKGSYGGAERNDFNDKKWRTVNLPHDWSIEDLPQIDESEKVIINLSSGSWLFMRGDDPEWSKYRLFEGNWERVEVPATWDKYPFPEVHPNKAWYRRSFALTEESAGKEIWINLGKIADADEVYFNGKLIETHGQMPPAFVSANNDERLIHVPNSQLNFNGKNVVAVRVYSKDGKGGIYDGFPEKIVRGPFDSNSEGGRSTGYTVGGVGWYRKTFHVGEKDANRAFRIIFDGVYMNSEVWINGHKLGRHPYGYTAFQYDITKNVRIGEENVLAVKVSNTGQNSRWYTGSGIYRNVYLLVSDKIYHEDWEFVAKAELKNENQASLNIKAGFKNLMDTTLLRWVIEIENDTGIQIARQEKMINVHSGDLHEFEMDFELNQIVPWSVDNPNLYTLRSAIFSGMKPMDGYQMKLGIRDIRFTADKGFLLNDKAVELKGGNIHHDNGALGAKAYKAAEYRKIRILKEAGFNAIRTAHNPPSAELINACDELGMLVIEEAFDMWRVKKKPHDYHLYFDDYWESDIESMVTRDRNHPSVIMWSIGNEVPERFDIFAPQIAEMLKNKIIMLDDTRPITTAVNKGNNDWVQADKLFDVMDVAGYNYRVESYATDHRGVPERIIYGAESFPAESWYYWQQTKKLPYVIGDFVWAAQDYLGEAAIGWWSYKNEPEHLYPWTVAYCGDLDITGAPRPQWYYRNTMWSDEPQIHMFVKNPMPRFGERERIAWGWEDVLPRWTWQGHEELFFEVVLYTNCDEVKLFSNGREVGSKMVTPEMENRVSLLAKYQPGVLTAAGIVNKRTVVTSTLRTAEFPAIIDLKADKKEMLADGMDLVYIDVEIHDANDVLNPMFNIPLSFSLTGPGEIVGIGNADPQNTEGFQGPVKTTYEGKCQVIIRSLNMPGTITLNVADIGRLRPGTIQIRSRR